MRGERGGFDAMVLEMQKGKFKLSNLSGRPPGTVASLDWLLDLFPGVVLNGRADLLRLMNKSVEAAGLPPEKQRDAFDQVDNEVRANPTLFVRVLMPASTKVSEAHRRTRATLKCAMVGVAAERYRLDLSPYPTIVRIYTECMKLDAFAAAHPDNQPDRDD